MNSFGDNLIDKIALAWTGWRGVLHARPVQFLGFMIGMLIVILAFASIISQQSENTTNIGKIKSEFCSGQQQSPKNTKLCQDLLDQLLLDPTPEQKEELRKIVLRGDN